MDNPFALLKERQIGEESHPPASESEQRLAHEQRRHLRDAIYSLYAPLVTEVLDQLIAAYRPDEWKQGSDSTHLYCCRINWFAGPIELYNDHLDPYHQIRRRVEITLEQDRDCNPIGFRITNHENQSRCTHVGLSRADLVRGIQEVFDIPA